MVDLHHHLDEAFQQNQTLHEEHDHSLGYHGFLSPVFNFARIAKSHPFMENLNAADAALVVDDYFMGRGGAESGWAQFSDDARSDFLAIWDAIKCLPGENYLTAALRRSQSSVAAFAALPQCKLMPRYAAFLALAAELEKMQGEKPILLPCRNIGAVLEVDKNTVTNYRKLAVTQGFLTKVRSHFYSEGRKDATAFRFDISKLP